MRTVEFELIALIIAAAVILGSVVYTTYNYNLQANQNEFQIQKVCIEGGGTYIRHTQQCMFPAMPAGKVAG